MPSRNNSASKRKNGTHSGRQASANGISANDNSSVSGSGSRRSTLRHMGRGHGRFKKLAPSTLLEIFRHLEPPDLLRLSRTTKNLRQILGDVSATHVWQQARMNAGIPGKPRDLSELEYANLAFSEDCYHCEKQDTGALVMWELRTRVCIDCLQELYFEYDVGGPLLSFIVSAPNDGKTRYCRKSSLHMFLKQYDSNLEDDVTLEPWIQENLRNIIEITAHAGPCRRWELSRQTQNSGTSKVQNVIEREEDSHSLWEYYGLAKQPKILTDDRWREMRANLVSIFRSDGDTSEDLESRKRFERRAQKVIAIIDRYLKKLDFNTIAPGVADIACSGKFKEVLLNDNLSPLDITTSLFQHELEELPKVFEQWRSDKDDELQEMLTKREDDEQIDELLRTEDLENAATMFHCIWCQSYISYPRILVHRCCTHPVVPWEGPEELRGLAKLGLRMWTMWGHSMVSRSNITTLLWSVGDPELVTTAQIEEDNPFMDYYLPNADSNRKKRYGCRWTSLFEGNNYSRRFLWESDPQMILEENASEHRVQQKKRLMAANSDLSPAALACRKRSRCRRCFVSGESGRHMMRCRGIQKPGPEDWIFHIDYPFVLKFEWPRRMKEVKGCFLARI